MASTSAGSTGGDSGVWVAAEVYRQDHEDWTAAMVAVGQELCGSLAPSDNAMAVLADRMTDPENPIVSPLRRLPSVPPSMGDSFEANVAACGNGWRLEKLATFLTVAAPWIDRFDAETMVRSTLP